MTITERDIKAALDGTLRRVNKLHEFVTEHVALDFVPSHVAKVTRGPTTDERPRRPRRHYRERVTSEEQEQILAMRRMGMSYRKIAAATGRDHGVIRVWISRWTKLEI